MGLIDLGLAVGAEDQQRRALGSAHDVAQQLQRRGVGPVQIVEDQDQRMLVGDRAQQRCDRLEQQELFALGRPRRRS